MGLLIKGKWHDVWYDTESTKGHFKRSKSQFRNWVTSDGSAGPSGEEGFKAEPGRYHLYVSLACPWAHRTLIYRTLLGLENIISISIVDYFMGEEGWTFHGTTGSTGDALFGAARLYEIYTIADSSYTGRVTVPVLWDKKKQTIVSNESSEIIRMLNNAFREFSNTKIDFYPLHLQKQIDILNDFIYTSINNGVYQVGFATTQKAYEEAFNQLFTALDSIEQILASKRYLTGSQLTEADLRLFPTLIRFDTVYVGHFKCNLRSIEEYPNLSNYLRELYQIKKITNTVNFKHIKGHYYTSHKSINPSGIVPLGPNIDYTAIHNRTKFISKQDNKK